MLALGGALACDDGERPPAAKTPAATLVATPPAASGDVDTYPENFLRAKGIPLSVQELVKRAADVNEDREVRYWAAIVLGRMGDQSATPVLLDLLDEQDLELRAAAALALGELKDPIAVPRLKTALQDPEEAVRSAAIQALAQIGGGDAIAALGEALLDTGETTDLRVNAALRLGRMDPSLVEPWLRRGLTDPSFEVRTAAAVSLAQLGVKDAIPFLIEALREPAADEWLVDEAVVALRDLTSQDFGYPKEFFAPATAQEREAALQKWIEWWDSQPR